MKYRKSEKNYLYKLIKHKDNHCAVLQKNAPAYQPKSLINTNS